MKVRFKVGAILVAMATTLLAFTSPALAKGGGGDGKTPCAQITSFTNTPTVTPDKVVVSTAYSVTNSCVDERMASTAVNYRNDVTCQTVGRSVIMASYGPRDYTTGFGGSFATPYTITLTVTTPNGKIVASSSQSLLLPAAPAPAA